MHQVTDQDDRPLVEQPFLVDPLDMDIPALSEDLMRVSSRPFGQFEHDLDIEGIAINDPDPAGG